MQSRPEFTVIAGPNGAGKSRLSPYYIHCKSFDGNLLALNLRKEHPEWEERWISGTVAGELQKQKDNAITLHKDFAFETNFSNELILTDNITFIDGNSNFGEVVAIYIKKSGKHEITNNSFTWFNQFFVEAFDKLK